jgi:hypothetical protein
MESTSLTRTGVGIFPIPPEAFEKNCFDFTVFSFCIDGTESRMFSRMSFGHMVIWSRGLVVAVFGGECLVAVHLVAVYLVAGHLDARSFSRLVIRSHGYLVASHLVAGHLVADHLVALNEKSILTYLQK